MKTILCLIFSLSSTLMVAYADDIASISAFQPNGSISNGLRTLSQDAAGVSHLTVAEQAELIFETYILLDHYYLTPHALLNPVRSINQHYKLSTFSSDFPEISLAYMSELHLQESGKIKLTTLFSIPTGYELKYAVIKMVVKPLNASSPIIVFADGKREELKTDAPTGFNRIFSKIDEIVFYPDNPALKFSIKSNAPFLLQKEGGPTCVYIIQLPLEKPSVMEITLGSTD